jgi:hypothetical protein
VYPRALVSVKVIKAKLRINISSNLSATITKILAYSVICYYDENNGN